jgi:hypothetical protein
MPTFSGYEFFSLLILASASILSMVYIYTRMKKTSKVDEIKPVHDIDNSDSLPKTKRPERPDRPREALYIPKDIGHRTGTRRVFNTSKGLRVFETNYQNFPMPPLPVPRVI